MKAQTDTLPSHADVLGYWIEEVGPDGWYRSDAAIDDTIRTRFGDLWRSAARGDLCEWQGHPDRALALLIVLDQFPRNMFRDGGEAFATDAKARSVACYSLDRGWDKRAAEPQRQFFYLPFMHSESLSDQEKGVRLIMGRMPETGAANLLHARAHREVIRRFGRFPHRNAALGRATKPVEAAFLDGGGYGRVVEEMKAA